MVTKVAQLISYSNIHLVFSLIPDSMDLQAANLCQQTSQKSTSTNVNFLPNGGIDARVAIATNSFEKDQLPNSLATQFQSSDSIEKSI